MQGIIVSDTSSLILLEKINRLDILKSLFGKISITPRVKKELNISLPGFIEVLTPKNQHSQKILESILDSGEASILALALENENSLLIIDEYKGRREAKTLGIKYTGIIGIIILAKEKGIIKSVTEVLEEIQQTDFRISESLIKEAKKKSGE